jgi:hypothetical protein
LSAICSGDPHSSGPFSTRSDGTAAIASSIVRRSYRSATRST